ncbi:MAG: hypothetical protein AB7F32_10890 [Victivallaceae bacterium]
MDERVYLRELAGRVIEISQLPVVAERKKLWCRHNAGEITVPPVMMEHWTFDAELIPPLKAVSPVGRMLEKQLLDAIVNFEEIGDDKMVTPEVYVPLRLEFKFFGLTPKRHQAADVSGRKLGFSTEYPIVDLEREFESLGPSVWNYDAPGTEADFEEAKSLLGDLLTVRKVNLLQRWFQAAASATVPLLGMENMFVLMMEQPDLMQRFFTRLVDDSIDFFRWLESGNLLTLNNGNDYAGSGSYGMTEELPQPDFAGRVRCCDLWGNLNSQETVGMSPQQFADEIYPHYARFAEIFGLVYYGCCEPVDAFWGCLKNLPHLRKVSCSPWCDDKFMGAVLRGTGIVLCAKPSPNFIGVSSFDEQGLYRDVAATIEAARGCALEFSFRDIYTLCGDPGRARRAVELTRRTIAEHWRG